MPGGHVEVPSTPVPSHLFVVSHVMAMWQIMAFAGLFATVESATSVINHIWWVVMAPKCNAFMPLFYTDYGVY